jgi:hypothetical protein
MTSKLNDLAFYYSGGAGNSDPRLSKGGSKGARIYSLSKTLTTSSIDGLAFIEAVGFADEEEITITYNNSTDELSVNSPSLFQSKTITEDSTVVFSSNSAYLIITVVFSLIESSINTEAKYKVNKLRENIFDDAEPIHTTDGYVDYRVLYLYNESSTDATNVTLFVNQPSGDNDILISHHTLNTDVPEKSSLEEEPANSGWQYTYNYSSGINIGTLPSGEYIAVVLQRVIYGNIQQTTNNQLVIVAGVD